MQLASKIYQDRGGEYEGKEPSAGQNSMKKWTKQDWQTRPGTSEIAERSDGSTSRYLPKKKWESLSKEEQVATDRKKLRADEQYVRNTEEAKVRGDADYYKKAALWAIKMAEDARLQAAGVGGYNQPKRTPGHPTKSHIVVAKDGDQVKTIRFGQQGVRTNQTAGQREAFKSRHAKNIAKGRMSAAYWADKVKWSPSKTKDKDNDHWVKGSSYTPTTPYTEKDINGHTFSSRGKTWQVARLHQRAAELNPYEVPLEQFDQTLGSSPWGQVSLRNFVDHMNRVSKADLNYPIILSDEGRVMDGMHRLARALQLGRKRILAVRFPVTPEPDMEKEAEGVYRPRVELFLHDGKGNVLANKSDKGWQFPGGGIEEGQDIFDAARREALEEVGYKIRRPKALGTASMVPWPEWYKEVARKKGRGQFEGQKTHAVVAQIGKTDKKLLGSEGDALTNLKFVSIKKLIQDGTTRISPDHDDIVTNTGEVIPGFAVFSRDTLKHLQNLQQHLEKKRR
jgi:8-oxo-dGTP pyrophosphatase MutT (NUDIX family)